MNLGKEQAPRNDVERILNQLNDHYVAFDREWRYVFVNQKAAEALGLPVEQLLGRCIWELFPQIVGDNYYQAVQRALHEQRNLVFEYFYAPLNRWFENRVYAAPEGVAVLGTDISERKRKERNAAFLAELGEELAQLTGSAALMRRAAERVGRFFEVARCAFAEYDVATNSSIIRYDWHGDEQAVDLSGQYNLSTFVTDSFRQALVRGEPIVVADVAIDERTAHAHANYHRLNISSFLNIPHLRDGALKAAVVLYRNEPYQWGTEEVELLRELTARLWLRIERARAEERMRALQAVTASFAAAQSMGEVRRVILQEVTQALGADRSAVFWVENMPFAEAARTHEALFFTNAAELKAYHPELAALIGNDHTEAGAQLPLKRGDEVFAVLSLAFPTARFWDAGERAFALALAERAAVVYERARLFDAMQASEARFRAVVEATTQIIWTEQPDGPFAGRQESWERFTGQSLLEYTNGGGFAAIHPDDRAALRALWQQMIAVPATYEIEYRLRRHDGEYRWMRARATPLLGPDGTVVEWVGVAEDRTEQRQRELNSTFLDQISQALTRLGDDQSMMQIMSERIVAYLGVWRCQFTEYDAPSDTVTVVYDWSSDSQIVLRGTTSKVAPIVGQNVATLLREGQQFVVFDTASDPATVAAADKFAHAEIGALVTTPYLSGGRWKASLGVHNRSARAWRSDELELLRELTERIWTHIERVRAEMALREREAQLAAFMRYSPGSLFIKDAAGRYVLVNHAFLAATSKAADEVIGKTDDELFVPELAKVFTQEDQQVRASGQSQRFEETFAYGDQTITFLSHKFPLPNGGIGCVGTDITERKRMEQQLTYANYRFQLAEEAAKGFTYEWNLETGVVTRSKSVARVLGYPREELPMNWEAWSKLVHPDYRPFSTEAEAAAWVRQQPDALISSEYRVRHRDGHYIWVLERALCVRDEQGVVQRVIGQTVDISERKAFEAEREQLYAQERAARAAAEEASRLKDEFLATVSHELRTPLTALLGYAQLLQTRKRDEAYVARTVEKMLRSAKAQAQLIEDLLDIARIVSGTLRLEMEPVDLCGVVRAALDTTRPAAEAKSLTVQAILDPAAAQALGDAHRLQQVVWNLLSNAIKFTPPSGTVTVTLERQDGYAQLTVRDTGQGIPLSFLPHVWDRFRQADGATNRAHGGLGLGLSIVRHLVELHNGTVEATSAGEGQGAAFSVRLPLAPEQPLGASVEPHGDDTLLEEGCPPELHGLRVLIVDDQPDILELLHEVFVPCGASVRTCDNAQGALATIRDWRPDVLVSDIAMPGEDGYWLIAQVRALPVEQNGNIPIIALTAYGRAEDRMRVLAAGFDHYLPKPIDPSELRAVVARYAPSSTRRVAGDASRA